VEAELRPVGQFLAPRRLLFGWLAQQRHRTVEANRGKALPLESWKRAEDERQDELLFVRNKQGKLAAFNGSLWSRETVFGARDSLWKKRESEKAKKLRCQISAFRCSWSALSAALHWPLFDTVSRAYLSRKAEEHQSGKAMQKSRAILLDSNW